MTIKKKRIKQTFYLYFYKVGDYETTVTLKVSRKELMHFFQYGAWKKVYCYYGFSKERVMDSLKHNHHWTKIKDFVEVYNKYKEKTK